MQSWLDRCIFNATAGGLTDFAVASAVTGYQTPTFAGAVNGVSYHYSAQTVDNTGAITAWEVGTGVWNSVTTTLTRATFEFSSTGSKVNFATAPQVMICALAQDFREIITVDTIFYVATTGNDNNKGTLALPFKTITKAIKHVCEEIYISSGIKITVQVADGTYNEAILLYDYQGGPRLDVDDGSTLGSGGPLIKGNATTPANVVIQPTNDLSLTNDGAVIGLRCATPWEINGVTIDGSKATNLRYLVQVAGPSILLIDNFDLVAPATWTNGIFFFIQYGATINVDTGVGGTVTGGNNASAFWDGFISTIIDDGVYTFANTVAWSVAFMDITYTRYSSQATPKYSGTVTGSRFSLFNSDVLTGGEVFPGNANGVNIRADSSIDGFRTATRKAGAPAPTDLVARTWGVFKDTSGGTVSLVYNDDGTLRTVNLT